MKRHLLMHLWPLAGSAWELNLAELTARWPLFTGRKILGVVESSGQRSTVSVEQVRRRLPGDAELIVMRNDPELREVQTWDALWASLRYTAADEDAVFYCHGKGVTHPVTNGSTVHGWVALNYMAMLDYWSKAEELLRRHPIVGCFKKTGYGFGPEWGTWHYSGAFFWSRYGTIIDRLSRVPMHRIWHGIESWPGSAFYQFESGCLFHQSTTGKMDLYVAEYWQSVVIPEWQKFLQAQRARAHAA